MDAIDAALPSNSKSPFFKLPRELRDQIYHHVYNGLDTGCFKYGGTTVDLTYKAGNTDICQSSTWFLASKQLATEALEQFHRLVEFSVNSQEYNPCNKPRFGSCEFPILPIYKRVRHLTITKMQIDCEILGLAESIYFNNHYGQASTLECFLATNTVLRDLTLQITLGISMHGFKRRYVRYTSNNSECEPRFTMLDSLPKGLDRLCINFTIRDRMKYWIRFQNKECQEVFDNMYASLRAVVKEAADKSLVGAKIEWHEPDLPFDNTSSGEGLLILPKLLCVEVKTAEFRPRNGGGCAHSWSQDGVSSFERLEDIM